MNGQQRMVVCLAAIIGLTISTIVIGSMNSYNERMRIMAENGLCEHTQPSTLTTVWEKK
jgi:hypothetical protein